MDKDIIILMTACVNPPSGATNLKIRDSKTRLKQYKQAMDFWLQSTSYRVLFVENTLCDFSAEYKEYIDERRLEYLTFQGENYDTKLGKGFGEMLILQYAFQHSVFIQEAAYIAKITGRLTVANVNTLISDFKKHCNPALSSVSCNAKIKMTYVRSEFFIASKSFYTDYFFKYSSRQDESKGLFFERLLAFCICKHVKDGKQFILFKRPVELRGIGGSKSQPYPNASKKLYITTYFHYLLSLLKIPFLFIPYALRRFKRRYSI